MRVHVYCGAVNSPKKGMSKKSQSLANLDALLHAAESAGITPNPQASRQAIADFCRYLATRVKGVTFPNGMKPSPRMRQTLDRLLAGDSEKQIAAHLSVSPHTVHVYVKALYRGFGVSSRGELLAHFVSVQSPCVAK